VPPDLPTVGWRRGAAAGLLTVFLSFAAYVPAFLSGWLAPDSRGAIAAGVVICVILGIASALAIVVAFEVAFLHRVRNVAGYGIAVPRRLWSSVALYVPLVVTVVIVGGILTQLLGLDDEATTEVDTDGFSTGELLFFSFSAVVVAPWVEEVAMRGLLYTSLAARFGFWRAAFGSALVWSSLHLAPGVLVIFTLEGVVLAWLRRRTGSVLPCIAVHGIQNTIATAYAGSIWLAGGSLALLAVSLAVAWPRLERA